MQSEAKTSHEYRYLPADNPNGQLKIVVPREDGHEYDVNYYEGQFYIVTNKNAKNFRVVTAPVSDPSEKNWKSFIDHDPKVKIDGLQTFAGHLVVSEREGGLDYLRVIDMKTKQSHRIPTDESDYEVSLGDNREYNTSIVRFEYESMVTPLSVYDYDMNTHQRKLMKREEVPGGYDASLYENKRIWAVARDGTKVPISIVYKKGVRFDGTSPMLLYGVRLLRHLARSHICVEPAGAARSRSDLCDCLHPWRRRAGRTVARRWADDVQAEHLLRFRGSRGIPGQGQVHLIRSARHSRAQRGRNADGRGHEYAPRFV